MGRHLLAIAAAAVLLGLVLPGQAMAAKGGNKAETRMCRTQHDDLGFKNRGQCAHLFAKAPGFLETCTSLGGAVEAGAFMESLVNGHLLTYGPVCVWLRTTSEQFTADRQALRDAGFCAMAQFGFHFSSIFQSGVAGCPGPADNDLGSRPTAGFQPTCESQGGVYQGSFFRAFYDLSGACTWPPPISEEQVAANGRALMDDCTGPTRWGLLSELANVAHDEKAFAGCLRAVLAAA